MTDKEKYTDFLDRLNNLLEEAKKKGHIIVRVEDIENVFPELAESEDEKIRKELLEHCINRKDGKQVCVDVSDYGRWADWLFRIGQENTPNVKSDEVIKNEIIKFLELPHPQFVGKRHQEKWIAWLEKQGTPNQVSIWKHWKHWKDGICGNGGDKPIYLIKNGDDYSLSSSLGFECDYIELSELNNLMLEKQGEQKESYDTCVSTTLNGKKLPYGEKIDFGYFEKQGEQKEILCDKCMKAQAYHSCQDITALGRCYIEGVNMSNKVEPKFKVGDLIKHNKANIICKIISVNSGSYYVENIETNGGIELFNAEQNFHLWTIEDAKDGDVLVTPNYIYVFNSIDKETETVSFYCLMKKSDEHFSFGDYKIHDEILNSTPATKEQYDLLLQKMKESGYEWNSEKKELRKIEDEPENYKQQVMSEMTNLVKDYIQQKPTWSEEDEHRVKDTIYFLDTAKKHYASTVEIDACIDWLKSLKPQSQWKPSDGQMNTLFELLPTRCNSNPIFSLYNDLKKLRGG